ncbi:magnesium-translocating P-type ATPase [Brachyspira hyodysenteriae]|uniref:magnesium-translocating P-type ATPase n=1 Tax=Brachyspira hyodysenteriae TaxID=159 RepID=UPI0022CD8336|nr:magnesium-translocating P-type ATPase [Brachyspira hyodysenteriae]MCZ9939956.1 magnesium-translocating P-type ATPase [Brachyspira hyodysenteriae]MDA0035782.1 magnesium-translocating P-type ATPase [Brachyspira hyodysenteriae]MDA0049869.1 magnesium-translocating P-type ATPase [Brachyspira hyodysenteriae]MDA0062943.1 magnesium-translocating P-type ATPase [Brachyspira hyodysenteriae]MDA0067195.1 magnesium-translocating P-type ATPase [Brachyspira hyodysenteriae]
MKKILENKNKLIFSAVNNTDKVLEVFNSSLEGISEKEADKRLKEYGLNKIPHKNKKTILKRIAEGFINPFTLILFALAIISIFTDILIPFFKNEEISFLTVIIISTMITVSGLIRFIQEYKSDNASEKLLNMIKSSSIVLRENIKKEINSENLTVGDIVFINAGNIMPADIRIIESNNLTVSQSVLTGESEPLEKNNSVCNEELESVTDYSNIVFMGSNVISGDAKGIVISIGKDAFLGDIANELSNINEIDTSFTKGINSVSWLLIRFMSIMTPVVFFINGFTKGNWIEALLFAISIAVGLTPEMLPMIVSACLAKGAVSMSKQKTIIKNLNSIQSFGAMNILCTDKTGTLTMDKISLKHYFDINGNENKNVLELAYLNSYFQNGYRNVLDNAIIEYIEHNEKNFNNKELENYKKINEIPFDFIRRRLSILLKEDNNIKMITKGAFEEMISICSYVYNDEKISKITELQKEELNKKINSLNDKGMRVIALAVKDIEINNENQLNDLEEIKKLENEMVLVGYLAFLDPPKESSYEAIKKLNEYGVDVKILTGDNEKTTINVCNKLGININGILLGNEIDKLNDDELKIKAKKANIFAKLYPHQKSRIVSVLKDDDNTVGFMGDGINDVLAMKMADISISVDSAFDIAKEAADIILLEKDLTVLERGIIEGRKTYANMIKYIKITASSNFGNMFSVLMASILLPFIPMQSVHLIILNLIYDLSCTSIPWDNVDKEFLNFQENGMLQV